MHHAIAFPVYVTFEDGTTEVFDDVADLECNLEHFDSVLTPTCSVRDATGQKLVLRIDLLELKELRPAP